MLPAVVLIPVLAVGFSDYPVFVNPKAKIEAVLDRGPIQELIVKCPRGTAIIAYSKIERLFCPAKGGCTKSVDEAIGRACR
ncbi:MAG TPA: hypothetical protein PK264_08690 [Hyphomicrobiaceae bacterium]|nr:hypothetical protein [Hyphomicrobiaceae bacterium]